MALLAVPNVSEGRDRDRIASFSSAIEVAGARVLDVHSDAVHNRSVLTLTDGVDLPHALAELAAATDYIDLALHEGAHPRLGGLDVCPIVPHEGSLNEAIDVAHRTGEAIWQRTNLPVYFYGAAAVRDATRELPDLRRGGLKVLKRRASSDLPPDIGPQQIDERRGVVCVGARNTLIAFNVVLAAPLEIAKKVAATLRSTEGGPAGVRALGIDLGAGRSQVSMNLTDPDRTGIEDVLELIAGLRAPIVGTEIVGLVPRRYLPGENAQATRLLIEPGRSVESLLRG